MWKIQVPANCDGKYDEKGRDHGETFSSTISGDGLRWFISLAVTCGKKIKGYMGCHDWLFAV
jgi:hypothetical protein